MVVLIALGIVMLYSTSSVRSVVPYFYLKRQLQWLMLVAVPAGVFVARFDYRRWRKLAVPLYIFVALLLVLVLTPLGVEVKGSMRWLSLGPIRVQPSEMAKLVVIICMAAWMSRFARQAQDFKFGFMMPLGGLGILILLVFLEPDFGTTVLLATVGMAIMFVGGARVTWLAGSALVGSAGMAVAVMHNENRMERMLSFLDPAAHPDKAYHLIQSKFAFIMGGPFGVGLGNSIQKHRYLPEAHTDFILSIIGEELGFIATMLVLALFLCYFICGITISLRASDTFGSLLGFGVTLMIGLQAAFNVGVVTGALPTKGLALPFISYGGSSLVMAIVMSSVLLSIAGHADDDDGRRVKSVKDQAHRL
jgi:cell division protein FtsW